MLHHYVAPPCHPTMSPHMLPHYVAQPCHPTMSLHYVTPLCHPTMSLHYVTPLCRPTMSLHYVIPLCCPTMSPHHVTPLCWTVSICVLYYIDDWLCWCWQVIVSEADNQQHHFDAWMPKGFYLFLYSLALWTLLFSPLNSQSRM